MDPAAYAELQDALTHAKTDLANLTGQMYVANDAATRATQAVAAKQSQVNGIQAAVTALAPNP